MKFCLIIARTRETREKVRRRLDEAGLLSAEAEDGKTAFVACQAVMPDIIIVGSDAPDIDQEDFTRKIKSLKRSKKTLILDLNEFTARSARAI